MPLSRIKKAAPQPKDPGLWQLKRRFVQKPIMRRAKPRSLKGQDPDSDARSFAQHEPKPAAYVGSPATADTLQYLNRSSPNNSKPSLLAWTGSSCCGLSSTGFWVTCFSHACAGFLHLLALLPHLLLFCLVSTCSERTTGWGDGEAGEGRERASRGRECKKFLCPSICISICLSAYLSTYLSIYLDVYMYTHTSTSTSTCGLAPALGSRRQPPALGLPTGFPEAPRSARRSWRGRRRRPPRPRDRRPAGPSCTSRGCSGDLVGLVLASDGVLQGVPCGGAVRWTQNFQTPLFKNVA